MRPFFSSLTFYKQFKSKKMPSTASTLRYHAHVCDSVPNKDVNEYVVSEIRAANQKFKEERNRDLSRQEALDRVNHWLNNGEDEIDYDGGDDAVDGPASPSRPDTATSSTTQSRKYFRDRLLDYVRKHKEWCNNGEMGYIYKTYFSGDRCYFSVINLGGDLIITRDSVARNLNEAFADQWFEGALSLVKECINIK
jgi:hypothetical protein